LGDEKKVSEIQSRQFELISVTFDDPLDELLQRDKISILPFIRVIQIYSEASRFKGATVDWKSLSLKVRCRFMA